MHNTSFLKASAFFEIYVRPRLQENRIIKILDIGSKSYEGQRSYKQIFDNKLIEYRGLDLESGLNVDLVPKNSYIWDEIGDEEYDFCISGQTFEHNPYFWITFAEIARVLKQQGKLFIIAPGRGSVHRYPLDCWRFYPDAWISLCTYSGLELIQSYFEDYSFRRVESGSEWCDSCVIASKPVFRDATTSTEFYNRLRNIVATLPIQFSPKEIDKKSDSEFVKKYTKMIEKNLLEILIRRFSPFRLINRIFRYF